MQNSNQVTHITPGFLTQDNSTSIKVYSYTENYKKNIEKSFEDGHILKESWTFKNNLGKNIPN